MKISRYKHDLPYSYALGMTLVMELLLHKPYLTEVVFFNAQTIKDENFKKLVSLCEKFAIPIEENEKIFNILTSKGNCYVIGVFKKFETTLENASHIVLVNPSDAGNLGTILRTIVGFDFKNLIIIRPAVDLFDPKVVRASMGALFHINFKIYDTFNDYLLQYKNNHFYPFMLTSSNIIQEVNFQKPFSLIFGNEATGLPEEYAKIEGALPVRIPHSRNIDSLNLTLAVGIGAFYSTINDWR